MDCISFYHVPSKLCLQSQAEPMCPTSFALPDESSGTSHRAVAVVVAVDWPVLSGGSVVKKTDIGQSISDYEPHFDSVSIECVCERWKCNNKELKDFYIDIFKTPQSRKKTSWVVTGCLLHLLHASTRKCWHRFRVRSISKKHRLKYVSNLFGMCLASSIKKNKKWSCTKACQFSCLTICRVRQPPASAFNKLWRSDKRQHKETTWWQCESRRQASQEKSGKERKMVLSWKSQGNHQVSLLYNKRSQTRKIRKAQRGTSAAPDFAEMCPPASLQKPLWWTLVSILSILYCICTY